MSQPVRSLSWREVSSGVRLMCRSMRARAASKSCSVSVSAPVCAMRSAVARDLRDQLAPDRLGLLDLDLAGARGVVAPAAVLQAQVADVGLRAAIQDRF